jgi:hypothetical protein
MSVMSAMGVRYASTFARVAMVARTQSSASHASNVFLGGFAPKCKPAKTHVITLRRTVNSQKGVGLHYSYPADISPRPVHCCILTPWYSQPQLPGVARLNLGGPAAYAWGKLGGRPPEV